MAPGEHVEIGLVRRCPWCGSDNRTLGTTCLFCGRSLNRDTETSWLDGVPLIDPPEIVGGAAGLFAAAAVGLLNGIIIMLATPLIAARGAWRHLHQRRSGGQL